MEHAYVEARALRQQVGETPELARSCWGWRRFHVARPSRHTARELGETPLRWRTYRRPRTRVFAHYTLGLTRFRLGVVPSARPHLEEGNPRYTPDQYRNWCSAWPDLGVAAVILRRPSGHWGIRRKPWPPPRGPGVGTRAVHPYSLGSACRAAWVYQFCRDVPAVHEQAEAVVTLATAQGSPLLAAME